MLNTESIKTPDDSPPRWVWWMALGGAGLVVLISGLAALVLGLGAADPPVTGPLRWSDEALAWAGGPVLELAPGTDLWAAAPPESAISDEGFTISVRATVAAESDPAAAWGIWLETDGARVVYAITSAAGGGYITTRRCPPVPPPDLETCPALQPDWRWSPYPRIHTPGRANTITLHREPSGVIRLRLNDEQLGAAPQVITGQWGVWARSGAKSASRVTWESATVR